MIVHVTRHAIERFRQRVEDLLVRSVIKRLTTPTIRKAVEFGASGVRLGSGHLVVIQGSTIVTVKTPRKRKVRVK